MRDDVYKSFFAKFKPIIDDCVVNSKVAEQNPELYTVYEMKYNLNVGQKVAYHTEKAKNHIDTLRELCSEVPQAEFHKAYAILSNALVVDEDRMAEKKDSSIIKRLRQQHNVAELFCSMLVATRYCRKICNTANLSRISNVCYERTNTKQIYRNTFKDKRLWNRRLI